MTNIDAWHVSDHELERYANHRIPAFSRASVEAHLLDCATCRSAIAAVRDPGDAMWIRIADRIDQPGRPMRSSTTALQVSTASPLLIAATLAVGVAVILGVGVVSVVAPRVSLPLFVLLAPLAPVLGVVLAFQTRIDPAGELAAATSLASGRLPFMRAALSSGVALVAVAFASLFVAIAITDVAVWLLPGVAASTAVAAMSTWIEPRRVALVLGVFWAGLVTIWSWGPRPRGGRPDLGDFVGERPSVQVGLAVLATCCGTIAYLRRNELPDWRAR